MVAVEMAPSPSHRTLMKEGQKQVIMTLARTQ